MLHARLLRAPILRIGSISTLLLRVLAQSTAADSTECCAVQVVQAIGAPESEPFNFDNPRKIDGDGAIALVETAKELDIDQFVMVTSLGTAKVGFPAGAAASRAFPLHASARVCMS